MRLNKFVQEVRAGLREGSVISSSSDVAENIDSEDIWHLLGRELEDVGISASVVEENHEYISNWLKTAISNGMLEEMDHSRRPEMEGSVDSGYGSFPGDTSYAQSLGPVTVANEEFRNHLAQHSSRVRLKTSTLLTKTDTKVRKASSVSSALFRLFTKDIAIIEAASDGDISKVGRLISSGANVNARDRWGVGSPACLWGHKC